MDRDNLLLGMIAVELGLVTPEQLEICTQVQETQLDPRPLGELFCEKGFLTPRQRDRLLQEQEKRQGTFSESGLFGQIALDQGFITIQQLGECIREQIRSASKVQPLLGEVMLRKEYLSLPQLKEILAAQGKQLARCSDCDRYDLLSTRISLEKQICPECAGPLEAAESRSEPSDQERAHTGNTTIQFKLPLTQLDKFQILGEIARGSMGIVFKAFDSTLDRTVALKVLKEGDADSDYIKRLHREGSIAAKLHHPNVVTIHEVGQAGGLHYLCMDYIEGVELLDYINRKKLGRKQSLRLMETISRAVHYAHANGVIHRDLKPSNILVDGRGSPIITDFGLAKAADTQLDMTKEGTALGTPYYMPPEQVLGNVKKIDPRSDVYSLGVILYEILAERHPFAAATTVDLYQKILHDEPDPLRTVNDTIDPDLEAIVMKAIEKDPEFRYFSAEDLAMDLRRYLAGDPILAKRSTRARRVAKKWKKHRSRIFTITAASLIAVGITFFLLNWWQNRQIRERIQQAQTLQEKGDWESAIREYREILTLDPDRKKVSEAIRICLRAMTLRADQDRKRGEWDLALQRYRGILSMEEGYRPAIQGVALCLKRLESALKKERLEAESRGRTRFEAEREKKMAAARPHFESGFRKFHDAGIYMHLPGFEPEKLVERYQNAIEDFTRAIDRAPDFAEAHFFRAKCHLHLDQVAWAKEGLSRVLELSPSHSAAWYERGKLQFLHGFRAQFRLLLSLIQQKVVLSEMPPIEALEALWKGSRADFENAMSYSSISSPRMDERFLARGFIDLTEGRYHDAVIHFTHVMGVNPVNADACFGRASAHLFLGEISLSLLYAERAILLRPDYSSAHVLQSLVYFFQKDYPRAIRKLKGELDRIPKPGILEMLSGLYETLGLFAEARACIEKALELLPNNLVLRERRALLFFQEDELSNALFECQAILGRDPNYVGAHRLAALIYSFQEVPEKAREHFEETLRLAPRDDEILGTYAIMMLDWGEMEGAFDLAERALVLNRKNANAWLVNASVLAHRGEVAEAVVRFKRSLDLNPGHANAWLRYGQALARLGKQEEAVKAYQTAKKWNEKLTPIADRYIKEVRGD